MISPAVIELKTRAGCNFRPIKKALQIVGPALVEIVC
jgi:hypothetical protein